MAKKPNDVTTALRMNTERINIIVFIRLELDVGSASEDHSLTEHSLNSQYTAGHREWEWNNAIAPFGSILVVALCSGLL